MKIYWQIANNWAVSLLMMIAALVVTWANWPERPWMEPVVSVRIVDGHPLFSRIGEINRAAPNASYGVDIKAMVGGDVEQTICVGGYNPNSPPNYAMGENPPKDQPLSWWIEKFDIEQYPNGCEAELRPGLEHIMHTSWCNRANECVSASVRWIQPAAGAKGFGG